YARIPVTWTPPYEAQNNSIEIVNVNDLLWEASQFDVGEARFIGISNSQPVGSGNLFLWAPLSIPLVIRAGNQPSIHAGDIMFNLVGDTSRDFRVRIMNILRGQNLNGFIPHLCLFDGDPEAGGNELSGQNYSRPLINFSQPAVQVSGQTQIQNTNLIRFPAPQAVWGNWAWDGIRDAAIGGNLVTKAINAIPELIQRNYIPQVPPGDYRIGVN
ncbi:MAG: hypothetical protein FWC41_12870, partial [Firmicutes bacterium]|nr:hypothetical protein [Bacillota bacterium]